MMLPWFQLSLPNLCLSAALPRPLFLSIVLDSSSIRASFLQSWRDLFQFEDGDLTSRCARLHSENMDWRIFFVNGAYRDTPMPLSLARFLLKGMQCPAVLLWNLGSHALHLLTETEATCWLWHLTLEGFPCIAWNSFTQRYFAIPAAIPVAMAFFPTRWADIAFDGYRSMSSGQKPRVLITKC